MSTLAPQTVRRGAGVPLLFVHGNGVDHRMMLALDDAFDAANAWERIYLDLPGFRAAPRSRHGRVGRLARRRRRKAGGRLDAAHRRRLLIGRPARPRPGGREAAAVPGDRAAGAAADTTAMARLAERYELPVPPDDRLSGHDGS